MHFVRLASLFFFFFVSCTATDSSVIRLNVLDYGAVGDGLTNDTLSINKTFNACLNKASKSLICEVYFPAYYSFLMYPLIINYPFNINVFVEAGSNILATKDIENWTQFPSGGCISLFQIYYAKNVKFYGGGVINGRGLDWWERVRNNSLTVHRPKMIEFRDSLNIVVTNLTLLDAPFYNVWFGDCINVEVYDMRILAPPDSPNTDGIDLSGGRNYMFRDSIIRNGDDCSAINSGVESTYLPTFNVTVQNLECHNSHSVSIGSAVYLGVSNVTFRDITLYNAQFAGRIKVIQNCTGFVDNIKYHNISIHSPQQNGFRVQMDYTTGCHSPTNFTYPVAPSITNIEFDTINVYNISKKINLGQFRCLEHTHCKNITINNVIGHDTHYHHLRDKAYLCEYAYGTATNNSPSLNCLKA
eukprot:TRINITY_DN1037_c0_g1_i1.p1 TRINITY_DN1037_c0_g1~~TRINITY_DN1037_c0_g1_i1.p1  ORF type:complete len:414 (-),score=70.23 TRINITY_DN1037_c0_g1_i1:707-1948(-)